MILSALFNQHQFDPEELPETYPPEQAVKERVHNAVAQAYDSCAAHLPAHVDRNGLIDELLHELVGLGPIEYYLSDKSVSEIYVSGSNVVLQRNGQQVIAERTFSTNDLVMMAATRLLSVQGYSSNKPPLISEGRFSDGTLVHITLPPVAIKDGAVILIRKPQPSFPGLNEWIGQQILSEPMAIFLNECVKARRTLLIAGPQGAGRTSFANAIAAQIPDGSRIVAIENTSTLKLPQHTAVTLESQHHGAFEEQLDLEALIQHAIRMRPDVIIADELTGPEAHSFALAAAAGAAGSIGVLTALDAADALRRFEQLALLKGGQASIGLTRQIARSIDVVAVIHHFPDGSRRVVEISEVVGFQGHDVLLEPIFLFDHGGMGSQGGPQGQFKATGTIPRFYQALAKGGTSLDQGIFQS